MRADDYVRVLNLRRHEEGGWYKENERTEYFTNIYFLLNKEEVSRFHRLTSDEVWYYHAGGTVKIYMINEHGDMLIAKLGSDLKNGEKLSVKIPAGTIFGAEVSDGEFALMSCMCAPAFSFENFERVSGYDLMRKYPKYAYVIRKLTTD